MTTPAKKSAAAPRPAQSDQDRLLEPFPAEWIGKLPRIWCKACSNSPRRRCDDHAWIKCDECKGNHSSAALHLDYVGHADITRRLLEVDPAWTWEPLVFDPETGLPKLDQYGGMWIRLSVHVDGEAVTRLGYGDSQGKTGPNAVKEVIGDGLRNAAMRFGVALDLWAKGDRSTPPEQHTQSEGTPTDPGTTKKAASSKADDPAPDPAADAKAKVAQASAVKASEAKTLDDLKGVWDGAKEAGLLQAEVTDSDGVLLTLTDHITRRKTDLEKAS